MRYSYLISEKYVKGWNVVQAIREVIANALDACLDGKLPVIKWDAGEATVFNEGVLLERKHMMIGESDKSNDMIGQFGEGMKLAALVFVREHRTFLVHSGHDYYKFVLMYSEDFGCNTLAVDVETSVDYVDGTLVVCECAESEIRQAQAMFSTWATDVVLHSTDNGSKILDAAGKVCIMGVHVTDLPDALFGYDLHQKELLNRDRTIIEHDKVRSAISDVLYTVRDHGLIKAYLKGLKYDKDSFEAQLQPSLNVDWKKVVHELFGEKVCLISDRAADNSRAEYLGFTVLDLGNGFNRSLTWYCGLPNAKDVGCEEIKRTIPITELTPEERRVYKAGIRLAKKVYGYNPFKRWEGSEMKDIPVHVTDELKEAVLAQSTKIEMWLNRNILNDIPTTAEAILHETVHQRTGYRDCTIQFQQALDKLIRKLIYIMLTTKQKGESEDIFLY